MSEIEGESYDFYWIPGSWVDDELLQNMSSLYSAQYGTWGPEDPRSGEPRGQDVQGQITLLRHGIVTGIYRLVLRENKQSCRSESERGNFREWQSSDRLVHSQ